MMQEFGWKFATEEWIREHTGTPVVAQLNVVPMDKPAEPWFMGRVRETEEVREFVRNSIRNTFGIPDGNDLPPLTRKQKIRWHVGEVRGKAARIAYRVIAGYWPEENYLW
jgi:hypothetical protein